MQDEMGFVPYSTVDFHLDTGARLTVHTERSRYRWSDGMHVHDDHGGRTRIIIEGEHDFVERLSAAMNDELDVIRQQIDEGETDDWPPDDERYEVCVGQDDAFNRLAQTSIEGIGLALVTLRDEGQITQSDYVGVYDRRKKEWLLPPKAKQ